MTTAGRGYRIRVRFLPPVTRYVTEAQWHPSQKITRQSDGSILAEFQLADFEEIKQWLLSFGPNAIVLSSQELRRAIQEDIQGMLENYQVGRKPATSRAQATDKSQSVAPHARTPK